MPDHIINSWVSNFVFIPVLLVGVGGGLLQGDGGELCCVWSGQAFTNKKLDFMDKTVGFLIKCTLI